MNAPRKATRDQARRFLRRVHFLDARAADVATVLEHHGFIQIDPINVCGRMHDLILRNRVEGYREGGLTRHLHGDGSARAGPRIAFEHHLPLHPNLVALPLSAWPHLQSAMRARTKLNSAWSGRLTPREKEFAVQIFERFATEGSLGPESFDDGRKGRRVWGRATLAKATLQKLFFHGRLLISARDKNRRLYDLPERVLPSSVLSIRESTPAEIAQWIALTRMRQHRLTTLSRVDRGQVGDLVEQVSVEGCPPLFCLKSDLAFLEEAAESKADGAPLLLAPLDPMIYDRRVTRTLWDFDYNWEVYTPPSKRKRGYYALPILAGTELVGHVDPKADREAGRLRVMARSVKRGHKAAPAVGALARFLGLRA